MQFVERFEAEFVAAFLFAVVCFAIITFNLFQLHPLSFIVILGASSVLGAAIALESYMETAEKPNTFISRVRSFADLGISRYLPYLICGLLFVVPVEILLDSHLLFSKQGGLLFVLYGLTFAMYIGLSGLMEKCLKGRLDIKAGQGGITAVAVYIIPLLVSMLVQQWDYLLTAKYVAEGSSPDYILVFIIFSGIVPLRSLNIFLPRAKLRERLFTFAGVAVYTVFKIGLVEEWSFVPTVASF